MSKYTPGRYEGLAQGFASKIRLAVYVTSESIEKIEVLEEHETIDIGHEAIPVLIDRIIQSQSTDIDGVTGATFSTNGTIEAVDFALSVARGEREGLTKYHAGSYQESQNGLDLQVTFSKTHITDIQYKANNQILQDQKDALETIKENVLESQRVEFDSVSGASQASRDFRDALNRIYNQANAVSRDDRLEDSPLAGEKRVNFKHGSLTLDQIDAILNSVGEELLFVGPDLRFQWFSEGHRLYEYSDASIGQLYTDCHPPQARASSRRVAYELITRKRKSYSFWYKNKDNDSLFITYQALHDKDGKFIGMLGWTVNVQPYIDVANTNVDVQRRMYTDPDIPNPLNWETAEDLHEYQTGGAQDDPMRDYAIRELEKLEKAARQPGGELDTITTATFSGIMEGLDDPINPVPTEKVPPSQTDTHTAASGTDTSTGASGADTSSSSSGVDTNSSASGQGSTSASSEKNQPDTTSSASH